MRTGSICNRPILVLFLLVSAPALAPDRHDLQAADNSADDLKDTADRWIDLERRIAAEQNSWRSEKEILETSVEVLKKEQGSLKTKLEANELATGLFKKRLEQTEAEMAQHEAGQQLLNERASDLGARVQALAGRLPPPLLEKVSAMLDKLKLPADGTAITPAERTQTIVSILSAIDLFNNTLTLTHHLRQQPNGETIDVKVLYWGLAAAYGVDANATQAWLITPGPDGWQWHDQSANAARIKALIDTYEKQRSPTLVELPVTLAGGAL